MTNIQKVDQAILAVILESLLHMRSDGGNFVNLFHTFKPRMRLNRKKRPSTNPIIPSDVELCISLLLTKKQIYVLQTTGV